VPGTKLRNLRTPMHLGCPWGLCMELKKILQKYIAGFIIGDHKSLTFHHVPPQKIFRLLR